MGAYILFLLYNIDKCVNINISSKIVAINYHKFMNTRHKLIDGQTVLANSAQIITEISLIIYSSILFLLYFSNADLTSVPLLAS